MIICSKCGETMSDDLKFCPSCGTGTSTATKVADPSQETVTDTAEQAPQEPQAPQVPVSTNDQYQGYGNTGSQGADRINFGTAIKNFIIRIVDFRGTTGKREYWFGVLFFLAIMVTGGVAGFIPFVKYVAWAVRLAAMLAFVSSTVRRLRDLGRPWFRIFMYLIPIYGQILYFTELTK